MFCRWFTLEKKKKSSKSGLTLKFWNLLIMKFLILSTKMEYKYLFFISASFYLKLSKMPFICEKWVKNKVCVIIHIWAQSRNYKEMKKSFKYVTRKRFGAHWLWGWKSIQLKRTFLILHNSIIQNGRFEYHRLFWFRKCANLFSCTQAIIKQRMKKNRTKLLQLCKQSFSIGFVIERTLHR